MLTFDERLHEYRWSGEVVPSVTKILEECGLIDYSALPLAVREMALGRGRMVHTATHWDDEADLDESTVDPSIAPYLAAWRRFRRETGFVPEMIEQRRYNELVGYAGTIDRVGRIGKRQLVIDIKTTVGAAWVRYQLSAYAQLLEEPRKYEQVCVELHADETYGIIHISPAQVTENWHVFCSAVEVHYARRKMKRTLRSVAA